MPSRFASGFGIGFLLDLWRSKWKRHEERKFDQKTEVFLMIDCPEEQSGTVEQILWNHMPIGLAKVHPDDGSPNL